MLIRVIMFEYWRLESRMFYRVIPIEFKTKANTAQVTSIVIVAITTSKSFWGEMSP